MAATAIGAKLTIVNVVSAVATSAATANHLHARKRAAMAGLAADIGVRAKQWKLRLHVMVKCPELPGDRVMACVAIIFKSTVMAIVLQMAGNAARLDIGKTLADMAVSTLILLVLTEQWKTGQTMIKKYRVLPVNFGMTLLAKRTQGCLVDIVTQMARIAARTQLNLKYRFNMTAFTHNFPVSAKQSIVGIRVMIEKRRWPFGACMTGFTLLAVVLVVRIVVYVTGNALHA
jgi:hypothetical protein